MNLAMLTSIHEIVADSPLHMAALNQQLNAVSISQAWRESIQIDTNVDVNLWSLIDQGDCKRLEEDLVDVFSTKTFAQSLPATCATNPDLHGMISAWPVTSQSGDLLVLLTFSPDDELARSKEQYESLQRTHSLILNSAGEGIYGLDREGRMTFANAASTEILGWSVDECLGKSAHQVHHHSHSDGTPYPNTECPIYAALKDGEVHRVDSEVFWHADGRPIPVEYSSTPIIRNGRLDGAVVVFRDISQRLTANLDREDAFREVESLKEQLLQERDYLRDEIKVTANFGEIIGDSNALKRTLEQVEAVAETKANVLVHGESGVGKEMIARAIHMNSPRADHPMVKVNCASIPKELFESEFFGHVKGSFTGAHQDRIGRMQLADGGTLFLDEIGEIPLDLQSKLLRALQESEFERVGDAKTISVDVRIVAATNRDLEAEIKAGRFREDLYFRLSVFPVSVPPLRERRDDILPLTQHLLEVICKSMGREVPNLSRHQSNQLQALPWPGNIRELRNVLERAVILSKGDRLRLDLALPNLAVRSNEPSIAMKPFSLGSFLTEVQFREKEKQNLLSALVQANWKISGEGGAADLLGIKPSTLTYRMKAMEIEKPRG